MHNLIDLTNAGLTKKRAREARYGPIIWPTKISGRVCMCVCVLVSAYVRTIARTYTTWHAFCHNGQSNCLKRNYFTTLHESTRKLKSFIVLFKATFITLLNRFVLLYCSDRLNLHGDDTWTEGVDSNNAKQRLGSHFLAVPGELAMLALGCS